MCWLTTEAWGTRPHSSMTERRRRPGSRFCWFSSRVCNAAGLLALRSLTDFAALPTSCPRFSRLSETDDKYHRRAVVPASRRVARGEQQ